MSDPATDVGMELDEHPQDGELGDEVLILRRVVARLRVLAGRHGHGKVTWRWAGYVCTLTVDRVSEPR